MTRLILAGPNADINVDSKQNKLKHFDPYKTYNSSYYNKPKLLLQIENLNCIKRMPIDDNFLFKKIPIIIRKIKWLIKVIYQYDLLKNNSKF